jgi:hypothetical protein
MDFYAEIHLEAMNLREIIKEEIMHPCRIT